MEGLQAGEMKGWREHARALLPALFHVLDPTRRPAYGDQPYSPNLDRRTVAQDLLDIDHSHFMLVNLKDRGAGLCWVSLAEMMYGWQNGKVIFTVIEEGYNHPFVNTMSTEVHHDLESAIESLRYYV